jgi:hypothetical protein
MSFDLTPRDLNLNAHMQSFPDRQRQKLGRAHLQNAATSAARGNDSNPQSMGCPAQLTVIDKYCLVGDSP